MKTNLTSEKSSHCKVNMLVRKKTLIALLKIYTKPEKKTAVKKSKETNKQIKL